MTLGSHQKGFSFFISSIKGGTFPGFRGARVFRRRFFEEAKGLKEYIAFFRKGDQSKGQRGLPLERRGDIFLGFGEKLEERKGKKKRSHDGELFFF